MEVKDIIKNRRNELGMTMREVAEAVGVSEATISRWESGDIENMRRDKIAALASALKMSPSVIMGWEEPPAYYLNEETAQIAQELFDNKDMRVLFDAAKDSKPEDLRRAADILKRFKATNPDG
jgi:transcriptional regulator with XRE-family HTH domain